MGILGAMGILGSPGTAGLLMVGERVQSRGNGSPPSHVKRVITYFAHVTHPTHVRVLLDRTDRLPMLYRARSYTEAQNAIESVTDSTSKQ